MAEVRELFPVVFFGDPDFLRDIGMLDGPGSLVAPIIINEGNTAKPDTPSNISSAPVIEENEEDSEVEGDPKESVTPSATESSSNPETIHPSMLEPSGTSAIADSEN